MKMLPKLACLVSAIWIATGCQHDRGAKMEQTPPENAAATTGEAADNNVDVIEEHWPDGTLRLHREVIRQPDGTVVNHGRYTRWYPNGQKDYEATFVHGGKDGTTYQWHRNGQLWIEERYTDGKRDGLSTTWNQQGAKIKEERYAEGKPHGTWTVWNDKGKLKWQAEFDHGKPVP